MILLIKKKKLDHFTIMFDMELKRSSILVKLTWFDMDRKDIWP